MFKWIHAAIPAVLLHACIGSVYCWSQYSADIINTFGISKITADIGFMLIIFFLGMSAACFGSIIEKNPKIGAVISTILFCFGMTLLSVSIKTTCLPLMFIATSLIGCGTGVGYVTPIKTMMLYFSEHKGMASGLAITGFGLAKFCISPFIEYLLKTVTLSNLFLILAAIYLTVMILSTLLLRKFPNYDIAKSDSFIDIFKLVIKTKEYVSIWLMFCINITCGLAFIANEKGILQNIGIKEVGIILSMCALFNALGRIGFSTLSDIIGRKAVEYCVVGLGIIGCMMNFIDSSIMCIIGIFLIEANYGGGFSVKPSLLATRFGIKNASRTHAVLLTAWSFGGCAGPLIANIFGDYFLYIIFILFLIEFYLIKNIKRNW